MHGSILLAISEILHRLESHLSSRLPMPGPLPKASSVHRPRAPCPLVDSKSTLPSLNTFTNEIRLNIDVLRPCMVLWIVC